MSQKNKSQGGRKGAKAKRDTLTAISQIPTVDIYDSLFQKDALKSTLSELENLVDQDTQGKENGFEISILNLFFQLCGLNPKKTEINQDDIPKSIRAIFQRLYDQPEVLEQTQELPLIDKNSKDYKRLNSNLTEFWELLFSNKTDIISDSKLLKFLLEWFPLFSNSKIRVIRAIAAEILFGVVNQAIQQVKEEHQTRKFKKFIYDIYHQILKERIKDVDLRIRNKFLNTISRVFIQMPEDFLTQNEMTQIFTTLLLDKSPDNQKLALSSIQKLYSSKVQHNVPLISYANSVLQTLLQESYHNQRLSYQFLSLLNTLKSYSASIIFPQTTVRELFCGLLQITSSSPIIREVTQLYMKVLFPEYSAKSEKEVLSKMGDRNFLSVLIVKTPKTFSVSQRELIFAAIVDFSRGLFDIDELFLMMITETVQLDGNQRPMTEDELQNSLILIRAYIKNVNTKQQTKAEKESDYKQNILGIYNKRVLVYCKQIFYDKLGKHPALVLDFIRLFGLLSHPLPSSFQSYLEIIVDQLSNIFTETSSSEIMAEIVLVFKKVSPNNIDLLSQDIDPIEVERALNPTTIKKCSALVGQFKVPKFTKIEVLAGLAGNFEKLSDISTIMAAMSILNHSHLWFFKELTTEATQQSFKNYVEYREIYMRFLEFALTNPNEKCRKASFSLTCDTLCLIMNNRLQDTPILLYEPRQQFVTAIYKYLTQSNLEDLNTSFQDLSLRSTLNINCHKMVDNVLRICANSVKFSILECSIEFLLSLLNSEDKTGVTKSFGEMVAAEASKQNQNRFIFWRVFRQIILKIQKMKPTVGMLLQIYFSRKGSKSDSKALLNKLILFVAETIEQGFSEANPKLFEALQPILKKVVRRCQKVTFSKINALFLSKMAAAHDEFQKIGPVKRIKSLLAKYSGNRPKKEQKMEQESNSDKSEEASGEENNSDKKEPQKADSQSSESDEQKGSKKKSRRSNSPRERSYPKRSKNKT